jgi:hypothetical protein
VQRLRFPAVTRSEFGVTATPEGGPALFMRVCSAVSYRLDLQPGPAVPGQEAVVPPRRTAEPCCHRDGRTLDPDRAGPHQQVGVVAQLIFLSGQDCLHAAIERLLSALLVSRRLAFTFHAGNHDSHAGSAAPRRLAGRGQARQPACRSPAAGTARPDRRARAGSA